MGNGQRSPAIAIMVIGAALALAGCGGPPPSTTTSTTTGAASSSHAASHPASPTTRAPAATHSAPKTSATAKVADVDCGPITAANGQKLRLVAKGSAAGVAGCTEAINILTEYFQRGSESEGTAHVLTVQGWQCSTIDNGVTNEVLTGCEKDGLSIAARNS